MSEYKVLKSKNQQLADQIADLSKQLQISRGRQQILKENLQEKRLAASDFAGEIEKKIKIIEEKTAIIAGENDHKQHAE